MPNEPRESLALPIASFVLALLGLLLSPVLVGGVLGLVAAVLGGIHLAGRTGGGRGLAGWGTGLGLVAAGASVALGMAYYGILREATLGPEEDDAADLQGTRSAWVGTPPAPLAFTTLDGERVDLARLSGRPVVLNFWATWCGPCLKELPHLDRVAQEIPEAVVLGVSDEDEDTLREFVARQTLHYRVGSVPDPPAPYSRIRSVPTTVYIDEEGVVTRVVVGYQSYGEIRARTLARHAPPATGT